MTPDNIHKGSSRTGWSERILRSFVSLHFDGLSPVWKYAIAAAVGAAATAARVALVPWMGTVSPYTLAFLSAALSTVFLGLGPGVACIVLCTIAAEVFVMHSSLTGVTAQPLLRSTMAVVVGIFVCWLIEAARTAVRNALKNETRYRALFDKSRDAIVLMDAETGVFVDCNAQAEILYRRTRDELIGLHHCQVHPPGQHEWADTLFKSLIPDGSRQPVAFDIIDKQGRRIPIEAVASVMDLDGRQIVQALVRDISRRKQAQEERFRINQRMAALMDALPVGVSFSEDATCQRVMGNRTFMTQFEAKPSDNLSASASDCAAAGRNVQYFRDGRQMTDQELPLQLAIAENREIPQMELEVVLPSGRRWFAAASGAPIRDKAGKVVGGVAVTVDITARKEAEGKLRRMNEVLEETVRWRTAELAESETKYRALIENSLDIPYSVAPTGTIAYIGPQVERYGFAQVDLFGRDFTDIILPLDRDRARADLQKTIETGETVPLEFRVKAPDGRVYWFEERGATQRDADGAITAVTGILRDTTTRRKAELLRDKHQARLQQLAAKLATAQDEEQRRIAEGLHDDVAQLLVACNLKLGVMADTEDPAQRLALLNQATDILRDAARKIRLLSFELTSSALHGLGLQEAIRELCTSMSARYDIALRFEGDGPAEKITEPAATVVFKAVRELLFNVVKHAGVKEATVTMSGDDRVLKLAVEDRGAGFPKAPDQPGIALGNGTGVAGIRERLKDIGGTLRIESIPGTSTTVTITLPLERNVL